MEPTKKKRFFLNHKKSSAFVVSLGIHALFLVLALSFVAVKVIIKNDQVFEVKEVKRPNMKLRKLQVPVKEKKKTQAPKLRKTIVAKPKNPDIDIKMPEIVGVKGGTGYGRGGGLGGLGFDFDMDLFGSAKGSGNEFIGTFYDLKQDRKGNQTDIGKLADKKSFDRSTQLIACKVIKGFIGSGWNPNRLKNYFRAPKLKYTTTFMMPPMAAEAAPKAFGVADQVEGKFWICHYKGQIAAPETGRYRFCGLSDDILIVRVKGRVVLDGSWPALIGDITSWESRDDNSRKFSMNGNRYGTLSAGAFLDVFDQIEGAGGYDGGGAFQSAVRRAMVNDKPVGYMTAASRMVFGDWMDLQKGQLVDMEVIIGELPGGDFACRLLVEQQGVSYKMVTQDAGPRPVLPTFKTAPINEKLIAEMRLDPNEMTREGPSFSALENTK